MRHGISLGKKDRIYLGGERTGLFCTAVTQGAVAAAAQAGARGSPASAAAAAAAAAAASGVARVCEAACCSCGYSCGPAAAAAVAVAAAAAAAAAAVVTVTVSARCDTPAAEAIAAAHFRTPAARACSASRQFAMHAHGPDAFVRSLHSRRRGTAAAGSRECNSRTAAAARPLRTRPARPL
eukprot:CAMPEP_0179924388 /NCGR_PEP_ID=MMETSP0983-20121128/6687_1 /TAXON_ID=483367 /ORGANISM="non described non described, Strain CCMP 2436" /LENGTH=180 /DNA_ID=CAMNT_0021827881 /DNA_START=599 /DNA_END=1141 /DNA_ORIENTATION=-